MMSTDWRKLIRVLAILGGAYIAALGVVADLAQVLTLKYGLPLLVLLLLAVLGYVGWEQGRGLWRSYRALQTRLEKARDFILRSGERSTIVLLCFQARWLFRQHGQSIRVSEIQPEGTMTLDVSRVALRPDDNLVGMHFAIVGFNEGERAKGTVKLCDSVQACIELYERTEEPRIGDLAIPIEPPDATDQERLLGEILFIVSE
jgi:hypothetical protein